MKIKKIKVLIKDYDVFNRKRICQINVTNQYNALLLIHIRRKIHKQVSCVTSLTGPNFSNSVLYVQMTSQTLTGYPKLTPREADNDGRCSSFTSSGLKIRAVRNARKCTQVEL